MTSASTRLAGWSWWPLLAGLSAWYWPTAIVAVGLQLGLVAVRLLVEAQRRRTLLGLVARAPAGTMVVMAETSELPAVWLRIGQESREMMAGSVRDASDQ